MSINNIPSSREVLDHLRKIIDIPKNVRVLTLHVSYCDVVRCEVDYFPSASSTPCTSNSSPESTQGEGEVKK